MPDELEAILSAGAKGRAGVNGTYDLIMWTLDRIQGFSKTYRIPLGDRMQDTMYDTLDALVEAKYSRGDQKLALLTSANLLLERLRFQGRIAHDKECTSAKQHGHFSKLANEAGVCVTCRYLGPASIRTQRSCVCEGIGRSWFSSCCARRLLEQQRQQLSFGEPQQQHADELQRQQRFSCCFVCQDSEPILPRLGLCGQGCTERADLGAHGLFLCRPRGT